MAHFGQGVEACLKKPEMTENTTIPRLPTLKRGYFTSTSDDFTYKGEIFSVETSIDYCEGSISLYMCFMRAGGKAPWTCPQDVLSIDEGDDFLSLHYQMFEEGSEPTEQFKELWVKVLDGCLALDQKEAVQ